MTEVYTDASVSNGKAVVTCLVLNPTSFIGCDVNDYTNIKSSLQGELLGIRDALKYALSHIESAEEIVVYCDSNAALEIVNSISTYKPDKFSNIVKDIIRLTTGRTVKYELIKGHQAEHNPNKVVDLICNSVLRNM